MAYPLNMRSLDIMFALLFTGVVCVQLTYVMRENERVFRSLHAYELDSAVHELVRPRPPPSTYFALDWLVHPKHNRDGTSFFMRLGTETGTCYSSGMAWSDADCGPEWWQREAFCPPTGNGELVGDMTEDLEYFVGPLASQTTKDVLSHIYKADSDGHRMLTKGVVSGSSVTDETYWWKNTNMADVCRIERIGDMKLFINDDTTWGLASAHSASVLVLGAALVMWIANISDIVYNPSYIGSDLTRFVKRFKWLMLGGALFVIVVARVMSVTELTVNDKVMTRMLPNGSYYYVVLFVTASGYIFVNKTKHRDAEQTAETATVDEKEGMLVAPRDGMHAQHDHAGQPHAGLVASAELPAGLPGGLPAGLNVSGFTPQRVQLNAYLPRAAPGGAKPGQPPVMAEDLYSKERGLTYASFEHKAFDLQSSHFAVAQAFALPLLTLGVFMFSTNYDTDSNFQVLFWAIGTYGLIDMVVFRLGQTLKVYESLVRGGTLQAGAKYELDEVVGLGKVIDVIALVLQSLIGFLVFVCMRWHLALGSRVSVPVLGRDSLSERFLDVIPALYLVYFFVCNTTKTCVLLSMMPGTERKHSALMYYDRSVGWVASNAEGVLFAVLNFFVLAVTVYVSVDMNDNAYTKPFPLIVSAEVKAAVEHLVHQHRGGWTDI